MGTGLMSVSMKETLRNESPPIRIDRNGVWYFRGMEMTRFEIVQYFYNHLQRDANGKYRIEIADDQCPVHGTPPCLIVQGTRLRLASVARKEKRSHQGV